MRARHNLYIKGIRDIIELMPRFLAAERDRGARISAAVSAPHRSRIPSLSTTRLHQHGRLLPKG
jgi:hypothetical protein